MDPRQPRRRDDGQQQSDPARADQVWCVATEIDFDSTLVAGSSELIAG